MAQLLPGKLEVMNLISDTKKKKKRKMENCALKYYAFIGKPLLHVTAHSGKKARDKVIVQQGSRLTSCSWGQKASRHSEPWCLFTEENGGGGGEGVAVAARCARQEAGSPGL